MWGTHCLIREAFVKRKLVTSTWTQNREAEDFQEGGETFNGGALFFSGVCSAKWGVEVDEGHKAFSRDLGDALAGWGS